MKSHALQSHQKCPDDARNAAEAERLIHSLGNHLALIETHADHCRRQLAELAVIIARSES